jgi:hypothetical protein
MRRKDSNHQANLGISNSFYRMAWSGGGQRIEEKEDKKKTTGEKT